MSGPVTSRDDLIHGSPFFCLGGDCTHQTSWRRVCAEPQVSPKPTPGPASDPDPTKRPGEVSEQSRFFTGTVLESHDPASKENTPENRFQVHRLEARPGPAAARTRRHGPDGTDPTAGRTRGGRTEHARCVRDHGSSPAAPSAAAAAPGVPSSGRAPKHRPLPPHPLPCAAAPAPLRGSPAARPSAP
ncbi:oleosin-B6-like [Mustela erminea]|uniref:oleosin-B6-like n=1 Tax=Mustela erminea TaxID=36723 RepID=UPI001386D3AA|nr:oleosin-B6-like [Mustela erminea]